MEIKAWMALNFLHFNGKKNEVVLLGLVMLPVF